MENLSQKDLRPLKAKLKKACMKMSLLIHDKYYIIDDGETDEHKKSFYEEKLEYLSLMSEALNLTQPASYHWVRPSYLKEHYDAVIAAIENLKKIKIWKRDFSK